MFIALFLSSMFESLFSGVHFLKQQKNMNLFRFLFLHHNLYLIIGIRSNMAFVKIAGVLWKVPSSWRVGLNQCLSLSSQQTYKTELVGNVFVSNISYNVIAFLLSFNLAIYLILRHTITCLNPRVMFSVIFSKLFLLNLSLTFVYFFSFSVNLFFLYSSHSCSIFWPGFLFNCTHKTQSLEQDQAERSTEGIFR